ncbi:hypothetical protein C5C22_12920, partial [Rathayibacter rathayi]
GGEAEGGGGSGGLGGGRDGGGGGGRVGGGWGGCGCGVREGGIGDRGADCRRCRGWRVPGCDRRSGRVYDRAGSAHRRWSGDGNRRERPDRRCHRRYHGEDAAVVVAQRHGVFRQMDLPIAVYDGADCREAYAKFPGAPNEQAYDQGFCEALPEFCISLHVPSGGHRRVPHRRLVVYGCPVECQ